MGRNNFVYKAKDGMYSLTLTSSEEITVETGQQIADAVFNQLIFASRKDTIRKVREDITSAVQKLGFMLEKVRSVDRTTWTIQLKTAE